MYLEISPLFLKIPEYLQGVDFIKTCSSLLSSWTVVVVTNQTVW